MEEREGAKTANNYPDLETSHASHTAQHTGGYDQ